MKRLILILMAAAFAFSPMWVSPAEAGQGKYAAKQHALVKQRALARQHALARQRARAKLRALARQRARAKLRALAKHRALARHHAGRLPGKHHRPG